MYIIFALNIPEYNYNKKLSDNEFSVVETFSYEFSKFCISRITSCLMNQIVINKSYYGKPYIDKTELCFNVSHSKDWIICALCYGSVGVDIECIRSFNIDQKMKKYFSVNEWSYIMSSQNRIERFFEIWTIKESYLKYLGLGLNKRLSSFDVLSKNNQYSVIDESRNTEQIHIYTTNFEKNYKLSVCSEMDIQPKILYVNPVEYINKR